MSKIKKIIIAGGTIIAVLIGIAVFVFQYQFSAPQKTAKEERIVVNLTSTEAELIPKLKEQGYIRSEWAFNYVLKKKGWQGKIQPGGYNVSKGINAWELADMLVNHPYQKWVVIPEGLRKEEIVELVADKLGWGEDAKENFLNNAEEGYLFPDTYLLNVDYTGKDVAKRMKSQFNEKAGKVLQEFADANIRHDTAIILASLIQREAANEEEMPLIAGVIWNRLLHKPPMKLEIDATIQYIVGEPGNWWRPVKPEEYKIESPYNTYLIQGRPPAPICNPGLAAMEAVVHDQPSEYLYYLHDSEGQIHLAKTYEEHQTNIEQYLLDSIAGKIKDVALSARTITIEDEEGREINLALTEKTTIKLWNKEVKEIELKDLGQGVEITATGRWTGKDSFIPTTIIIKPPLGSIEPPAETEIELLPKGRK